MKITRTYCDCCEPPKEVTRCYTLDIELDIKDLSTIIPPKFGKVTLDGVWEIEVCYDCLCKAITILGGLKE